MLEVQSPLPTIEFDKLVPVRWQVADWLFRRILCCDLRPDSRLPLNRVAGELGVSATPVREAMLALESLGLLTFRHNCGATIKPFGVKELSEIYQVWYVLNQAMYRSARGNIDLHSIKQLHGDMLALQAEPNSDSWTARESALDHRLEDIIATGCDCRRLVDENNRYLRLVNIIRDVYGTEVQHHRRALQEHIEIVECLMEDALELLGPLVARHNHWCIKSLLSTYRRWNHEHDRLAAEAVAVAFDG